MLSTRVIPGAGSTRKSTEPRPQRYGWPHASTRRPRANESPVEEIAIDPPGVSPTVCSPGEVAVNVCDAYPDAPTVMRHDPAASGMASPARISSSHVSPLADVA